MISFYGPFSEVPIIVCKNLNYYQGYFNLELSRVMRDT